MKQKRKSASTGPNPGAPFIEQAAL